MSATLLELFKKVLTRKVFNSPKTRNLKAAYKLNGTTLEPGADLRFHILFWSGIFESNHYRDRLGKLHQDCSTRYSKKLPRKLRKK